MRLKVLIVVLSTILLISIIGCSLLMKYEIEREVDVVAINEIVQLVKLSWPMVEQGNYSTISMPFYVLSLDGQLLYQNFDGPPVTIYEAIQSRKTVVDITAQNNIIGKLIVANDDQQMLYTIRDRLIMVVAASFGLIIVVLILYVMYLNHIIFKPFKKLKSFAVNVARGNLELPLKMDKNNPFGAFTESFDMMREELAAARKSEYEANRSKKELVASLSHDIKTPVATIKAVSELMLVSADQDKTIKQLNTIYTKAEQINLLVTDMFHATLEELSELQVNVSEEWSTIINGMVENTYYENGIRFGTLPECLIMTDANRLQQVIDNVLSNAYKYAGTEVTIISYVTDSFLELHIADNGKGIEGEELPLLFNKFYRGSNAEGKSGSGLGLYISQYLMQRMQGDIACYNGENGFTVVLKIKLV